MGKKFVFDCGSDAVASALTVALRRRVLQTVRSFDLHSALATQPDCECAHHGTALCTCQFVVLLVYGEAAEPLVITAHSRDNQTEVQIVDDTTAVPVPFLTEQVLAALVDVAPMLVTVSAPATGVEANVP